MNIFKRLPNLFHVTERVISPIISNPREPIAISASAL